MTDYIDRDAVLLQMQKVHNCGRLAAKSAIRIVRNCPAADVEPIRHGRWKDVESAGDMAQCSECGECYDCTEAMFGLFSQLYHYCPNCGAKMDGDGNGEHD